MWWGVGGGGRDGGMGRVRDGAEGRQRAGLTSVNPLTPKSDWHLISPYSITPKSHIKV